MIDSASCHRRSTFSISAVGVAALLLPLTEVAQGQFRSPEGEKRVSQPAIVTAIPTVTPVPTIARCQLNGLGGDEEYEGSGRARLTFMTTDPSPLPSGLTQAEWLQRYRYPHGLGNSQSHYNSVTYPVSVTCKNGVPYRISGAVETLVEELIPSVPPHEPTLGYEGHMMTRHVPEFDGKNPARLEYSYVRTDARVRVPDYWGRAYRTQSFLDPAAVAAVAAGTQQPDWSWPGSVDSEVDANVTGSFSFADGSAAFSGPAFSFGVQTRRGGGSFGQSFTMDAHFGIPGKSLGLDWSDPRGVDGDIAVLVSGDCFRPCDVIGMQVTLVSPISAGGYGTVHPTGALLGQANGVDPNLSFQARFADESMAATSGVFEVVWSEGGVLVLHPSSGALVETIARKLLIPSGKGLPPVPTIEGVNHGKWDGVKTLIQPKAPSPVPVTPEPGPVTPPTKAPSVGSIISGLKNKYPSPDPGPVTVAPPQPPSRGNQPPKKPVRAPSKQPGAGKRVPGPGVAPKGPPPRVVKAPVPPKRSPVAAPRATVPPKPVVQRPAQKVPPTKAPVKPTPTRRPPPNR